MLNINNLQTTKIPKPLPELPKINSRKLNYYSNGKFTKKFGITYHNRELILKTEDQDDRKMQLLLIHYPLQF